MNGDIMSCTYTYINNITKKHLHYVKFIKQLSLKVITHQKQVVNPHHKGNQFQSLEHPLQIF